MNYADPNGCEAKISLFTTGYHCDMMKKISEYGGTI